MKAIKSAALPEPSQTTIGTGGSSVTYSRTALIVFVPPSITKQTMGMGLWVTAKFKVMVPPVCNDELPLTWI
jgi:hypothetical protein